MNIVYIIILSNYEASLSKPINILSSPFSNYVVGTHYLDRYLPQCN